MDNDVTAIILQKLDKLQEGSTAISIQLATLTQERKTDRQEIENLVNKSGQELCNHVQEYYVSKTALPGLIDYEIKKKKKEALENITLWQSLSKNAVDLGKILFTALITVYLYSKGFFASFF